MELAEVISFEGAPATATFSDPVAA